MAPLEAHCFLWTASFWLKGSAHALLHHHQSRRALYCHCPPVAPSVVCPVGRIGPRANRATSRAIDCPGMDDRECCPPAGWCPTPRSAVVGPISAGGFEWRVFLFRGKPRPAPFHLYAIDRGSPPFTWPLIASRLSPKGMGRSHMAPRRGKNTSRGECRGIPCLPP